MHYFLKQKTKNGFGMIEIIVAAAVISISLFTLSGIAQTSFRVVSDSSRKIQAGFLAEEGIEALKTLRDRGWASNITTLVSGTTYYPTFSTTTTNEWSLDLTSPGLIENVFERTIQIDDVYRKDSDDDIVDQSASDPKTLDPGTKKITSTVTWSSKNVEFVTYITDLFEN